MIESPHILYKKQYDFVVSPTRHTLYSGAVRAGKTIALVYRALELAKPGKVGLLGAWTYPMIKDIILPKLKESMANWPRHWYTWHKSDSNMVIHHGGASDSVLRIRHLEDEGKVGGTDLDFYCVDEGAVGIQEPVFDQLNARLSKPGASGAVATNPGSLSHFLYRFYFQCSEQEKLSRTVIMAKTFDNIYLGKEYTDDLKTRSDSWIKRYMEGSWGTLEGAVYDNFDRGVHEKAFEVDKKWEFWLLMDHGYSNPHAALLVGIENKERFYVIDELYERRQLPEHRWEHIKDDLLPRNGLTVSDCTGYICDSSPASDAAYYHEHSGLYSEIALKNRHIGIQKVSDALQMRGDGQPGIIIHPRCTHTLQEHESWEWIRSKDGSIVKEDGVKVNDHTCDALRYGVATLL